MEEYRKIYEIRHCNQPPYYCFLWVNYGQTITVFLGSEVYKAVKIFEKGTSPFKTVEELYNWALKMPR